MLLVMMIVFIIIIIPNSAKFEGRICSKTNTLEYPSRATVYKSGSITVLTAEILSADGDCEKFSFEFSLGITLVSVCNNCLIF